MRARPLLVLTVGLAPLAVVIACGRTSAPPSPNASAASLSTDRATLPKTADDALTLRDPASGIWLRATLRDAAHVEGTANGRARHFAHGAPGGGDLDFRPTATGAEDFVHVGAEGPSSLVYDLLFDATTTSLRFVENVLELVDSHGSPRLRVSAPTAVDANGKKHPLVARVEGCAVDRDPRPPFGRPPTASGSSTCTLHVSWSRAAVAFPIVVDPAWTTTESLMIPRYQHAAQLLPNGELLVAGGLAGDATGVLEGTDTVEIYSGGVWATGASMKARRFLAGDAVLANGDILMSGGLDQDASGQTVHQTAEIYSVADGTWSFTGALLRPRAGHTATPVGDGTVVVAGGYDNTPAHFSSAELFSGGTFTAAGNINTERFYHAAVTLSGNRVLLGGGTDAETGPLASLELYTAGLGWSSAASLASMASPRTLVTATLVGPDKVAFIAGYNKTEDALGSAETYDADTNTWTTSTGRMAVPRYYHAAAALADGRVLVVGGSDANGPLADGELYDPVTTTFEAFCGMSVTRAFGQSVSLLPSGRVLVTGGYTFPPVRVLGESDLFDPSLDGGTDAGPCPRDADDAGTEAGADASTDAGSDASGDAGPTPDGGPRFDAGAPGKDAGSSGTVPVTGRVREASSDDSFDTDAAGDEGCSAAPGGSSPAGTGAVLSVLAAATLIARRRRQRDSSS